MFCHSLELVVQGRKKKYEEDYVVYLKKCKEITESSTWDEVKKLVADTRAYSHLTEERCIELFEKYVEVLKEEEKETEK